MTTVEIIIAAIGGQSTLTAAGVGVWKLVQRWQTRKERADARVERVRLAEIAAGEREEEREASTIRELFDMAKRDRERLAKVELHAEECNGALAEQGALVASLMQANADCERRVSAIAQRVSRQEERTSDMTGKFRTAARTEVRKALSEPHGIPTQPSREVRKPQSAPPDRVGRIPPLKRSSRDDMEPSDE